jgi:hypothetical protein
MPVPRLYCSKTYSPAFGPDWGLRAQMTELGETEGSHLFGESKTHRQRSPITKAEFPVLVIGKNLPTAKERS